jgi:hypothetical protein
MSGTIFDLPKGPGELPSMNSGMSKSIYEQRSTTRNVQNTSFPGASIHIPFELSGQQWWVPSKSYIRLRCKLTDAAGTGSLTTTDQIAPNMGLAANLFQSGEFRIGGQPISKVGNFFPQVDALQTRLSQSKAWLDTVGAGTNFWQSSVNERIQEISSDGLDAKQAGEYEVTPQLSMGYAATAEVAIALDTGVVTFSVGANPDTDVNWVVGDVIEIDFGGTIGTIRSNVTAVPVGAKTMTISYNTTAIAADLYVFRRYRRVSSRRVREFEVIWQPKSLSIFNTEYALPGGKYEMVLNPESASVYKQRAIESLFDSKTAGAGNDFDFSVEEMHLYTAMVDSKRMDNSSYFLSLDEMTCQVDDAFQSALTQRNFHVNPSTYALSLAFQDNAATTTDTRYSASKFKTASDHELNLIRMYLQYDGQKKPQIDADPSYVPGSAKDYTVQRYTDSLINSGSFFDQGGAETLKEWRERGAYYHFQWPRDGTSGATRVQANFEFSAAGASNSVLLFAHHRQIVHVTITDGRIVNVQAQDA